MTQSYCVLWKNLIFSGKCLEKIGWELEKCLNLECASNPQYFHLLANILSIVLYNIPTIYFYISSVNIKFVKIKTPRTAPVICFLNLGSKSYNFCVIVGGLYSDIIHLWLLIKTVWMNDIFHGQDVSYTSNGIVAL